MTVETYLDIAEPKSYSKPDILEFFGIPPAPESELTTNIKKKRQHWGKRANGVGGREEAKKIKVWIQKLSKILENGEFPDKPVVHTAGGGFQVVGEPTTVAELAEQLEIFLRQRDVQQVLRLIHFGLDTWPDDPEMLLIVALAISELLRDFQIDDTATFGLAERLTRDAINSNSQNPRAYLARARYALSSGQSAELSTIQQNAAQRGVQLPDEVYGILATTSFRNGDTESGIRHLITQVTVSGGDSAARSLATDSMLQHVIIPMLPLESAKAAKQYAEMVDVASWLAEGVPESEQDLTYHRIWAKQATSRMYIGNIALKSFLGVLTVFTALPLVSKSMTKPRWRVLRDGPQDIDSWEAWCEITSDGGTVEALHSLSSRRFSWENSEQWVQAEQVYNYVSNGGQMTRKGKLVRQK